MDPLLTHMATCSAAAKVLQLRLGEPIVAGRTRPHFAFRILIADDGKEPAMLSVSVSPDRNDTTAAVPTYAESALITRDNKVMYSKALGYEDVVGYEFEGSPAYSPKHVEAITADLFRLCALREPHALCGKGERRLVRKMLRLSLY